MSFAQPNASSIILRRRRLTAYAGDLYLRRHGTALGLGSHMRQHPQWPERSDEISRVVTPVGRQCRLARVASAGLTVRLTITSAASRRRCRWPAWGMHIDDQTVPVLQARAWVVKPQIGACAAFAGKALPGRCVRRAFAFERFWPRSPLGVTALICPGVFTEPSRAARLLCEAQARSSEPSTLKCSSETAGPLPDRHHAREELASRFP